MDTSIEYIEMCRKAEEIQKEWVFEDGDYLYKDRVYCWSGYSATDYPGYPQDGVFLPRQDQLQEMFILKEMSKQFDATDDNFSKEMQILVRSVNFNHFVEKNFEKFNSFEKYWLAFVMKIKYGKLWVNGCWMIK